MKDPDLKIRYARGMGDFVACVLHSKLFGWLTKLITGKSAPCKVCGYRRTALNIIFPIKFWRLFFKNPQEMEESRDKDISAYNAFLTKQSAVNIVNNPVYDESVSSRSPGSPEIPVMYPETSRASNLAVPLLDPSSEVFYLISNNEQEIKDHLIRLQVFVRKQN